MGNLIKDKREELGISQEQLSLKSGVSRATLSSLETGKAENVSIETLRKIADAMGCKISEIFLIN